MNSSLRTFVLTILVASSSMFALAQARLDEMRGMIAAQVVDETERDVFNEAVEEYMQDRGAVLTTLRALIESTDADPVQGDWSSTAQDILDLPGLVDVDDDLTSDAALALYDQFVDEERAWGLKLGMLKTAQVRDEIVAWKLGLVARTGELDATWQTQLNADGLIDEKQLKVMADIYGTLAQLAKDSDGGRQSVRNSFQILTDLLSKVNVIPDAIPGEVASAVRQALTVIAETAKQYNAYATTVEGLRPQLRELAGQELGLLILFNETRAATQDFVDTNGFDAMKARFAEASSELDDFADVGSDAQRLDASAFADLLESLLSEHLAEGETTFNAFVAKHNLKFFGPVGPDIREALAETRTWTNEADRVKRLDLESLLSAWRSDANVFFGVNLSADGITDYEREYIEEQLVNDLRALQEAIDKAGAAFSTQNLSLLYDRREALERLR